MNRLHRLCLDPQGGVEGGSSLVSRLAGMIVRGVPLPPISGGGEDPPADPPAPPAPPATPPPAPPTPPAPDPAEGYKKLLEKHNNDAAIVAGKLYDENHSYRQTIRELKGKVPADGSMVLSADQAKVWTAYLELGKPEEIATLKHEHGQYATERQAADREKFHGEVADAHGYKVSVLSRLIDQDKIEVELKDATVNGKTVRVAHVKDGENLTPLPDYAKAHWGDFLDVLPRTPAVRPIGTPRTGANPPPPDVPATPPRPSLVR
jgi:hypothetical protein